MSLAAQHLTVLTGASRGMGLAMARHLLTPDRILLCISRRTNPDLEELARLRGATLVQWSMDLSQPSQVAVRLDAWLDAQPTADIASATLINNAGMIPRIGPIDQCPGNELEDALRVGLEAPMQLTAAFLRASGWRRAGAGRARCSTFPVGWAGARWRPRHRIAPPRPVWIISPAAVRWTRRSANMAPAWCRWLPA